MLGDEVADVLWDRVGFGEQIGGPFQQRQKDRAQPLALGWTDDVRGERAGGAPFGVELAEFARQVGGILDETLREDLAEDWQAEERA
jgi:hypothetical protein